MWSLSRARSSSVLSLSLSFSCLALAACGLPPPGTEEDEAALSATAMPAIGFEEKPSYLSNKKIALTFDDGPDYTNTVKVLDTLKKEKVKATFFINANNWSNIDEEPMRVLVRRMVDEGHDLGNHTVHHPSLQTKADAEAEDEIVGVETALHKFMPGRRLTLFRAPYGEPFQVGTDAEKNRVGAIVKKHAVHVGWALDSADTHADCLNADCVFKTVSEGVKKPGQGAYGQILLHSVQPHTAEALPRIIKYLRDNGFEMIGTEEMVCAQFNKSSANVVDGKTGGCVAGPDPDEPDAGVIDPDEPDAGTTPGKIDAGTKPGKIDAGTTPGKVDAGTSNPDEPGNEEVTGGCGCSGSGDATGGLLLGAAAALLLSRRRRAA